MVSVSNEITVDNLTTMLGSIGCNPSAVAPSVIEDRDDHSSWSASSTSNEDLPELSSLEMPREWPQHVSSQGYAGGSIEALLADFNTPVERVRLADGRWLYAKIFGYNACDDASSPAPVKISKTILRVRLSSHQTPFQD
jgi:hypothetical protein